MTTIWAFARPVPALLTAVHSYAPSSALEARGISQLLFPDTLQAENSWRHTIPLTPARDPQPRPAPKRYPEGTNPLEDLVEESDRRGHANFTTCCVTLSKSLSLSEL